MNKPAIKNFAVSARVKLKEQIEQKSYTFGITKNKIKTVEMFEDAFEVNGNKYNKSLLKHRESLVKKINEKGFDEVIEKVAYTWFNRLIAIRFMEVNEYLPSGVRVLSSTDSSKAEPDIIREAANLDFENLNIDLIYKLQDENNTEELFKYLLIKQCNELGKIMPVVFEEIEDFTELLLPDNLLQEGSIIRDLVTSIAEDDFKEQVEIIGWLYQYYISEKKDEVFADLKKNKKITKENIPAATQLFTPDWIVKYMVENSLGRLWIEKLEVGSGQWIVDRSRELKEKWKYYLEEAQQEPEVMKQLEEIREENKDLNPEDIKFLDPCMGSGHILVYAFDVLFEIYKSAGYSEREIPKLILEKNLYGLDIDDRAAQLAYFAVMMKARSYNRRIFREKLDLNICSIQESNDFPKEAIDFLANSKETEIEKRVHRDDIEYLISVFNDAKEYGSILEVKEIDFEAIQRRIEEIRNGDTNDIFEWQYKNIILEKIPSLIKQAKIMSQKYDVVCTNPPYMGSKGMNLRLLSFLDKKYHNSRNDLYATFIERSFKFLNKNGFSSMVTMHSWMFLSTFENMRKELLNNYSIFSILHLGMEGFDSIIGKIVQTAAFIIRKNNISNIRPVSVRLVDFYDSKRYEKEKQFFNEKYRYMNIMQNDFKSIPGQPIAYWINESVKAAFQKEQNVGDIAEPRQGLITANNDRFLRLWYEIDGSKIGFTCRNIDEAIESRKKWFPFNKGGDFRRWYGNNEYLVNWENDGYEIKNFKDSNGKVRSRPQNTQYYFKKGITWSVISPVISFRFFDKGFLFSNSGQCVFADNDEVLYYLMGLLNSKVANYLLALLSPTMGFESGYISRIPVFYKEHIEDFRQYVDFIKNIIAISKCDWDSFETSWEFKKQPLLVYNASKIDIAFNKWNEFTECRFNQLKNYEEKLNNIFIELYKLQDELNPEVNEKNVTIRKANRVRDIKSFISYAIGCMFGRYSLDEEGLIYAGGEFEDKWKIENGQWTIKKSVKDEEGNSIENTWAYATFAPDVDNVIPITDDEYFEDDIVSRFVEFVKITFSEESLEENLDYIADTLGKKGNETSRQTIRRYFIKDFYKDHVQTYQKRPIYWLFDSGKNDGFKALIYMHRYDISTVARVRTDYLHLLQRKYEAEVNGLDMVMENSNASAREKTEAKKKKEKIQKQILECVQYDQVIAHVANQKISIDLDDGVSVNYGKFQGIEVSQGEGKKPLKADLLVRI